MNTQKNIALYIILTIVTCGIFGFYWLYTMTNDLRTITGRTDGVSGGMVVVLTIVTCGIYGWFWLYQAGEAMDGIRGANGQPHGNLAILYLVLGILGLSLVSYALLQSELNKTAYPQ